MGFMETGENTIINQTWIIVTEYKFKFTTLTSQNQFAVIFQIVNIIWFDLDFSNSQFIKFYKMEKMKYP